MNYRPIGGDRWDLARPKLLGGHKYYGAYPAGFLERARALMAVGQTLLSYCARSALPDVPGRATRDTPEEAAEAYRIDASELHGEFARYE